MQVLFGHDVDSALDSIKTVTHEGKIVRIQAENMEFSYRKTKLPFEKFIITEGTFNVQKKNMQEVKNSATPIFHRGNQRISGLP